MTITQAEYDRVAAHFGAPAYASTTTVDAGFTAKITEEKAFKNWVDRNTHAHIFAHMFKQVDEPRFVVEEQVVDTGGAMLVWSFHFRVRLWGKGQPQRMRGVSHLKFNDCGAGHEGIVQCHGHDQNENHRHLLLSPYGVPC